MSDADQMELIKELEQSTPEEIRRKRAHFRFTVKATVTIQPGNSSQVSEFKAQGVTRDISSGGVGILSPIPIGVGDIYRLTFNPNQLDLPMTFARCVGCSLVREGAFNVGFKFFAKITLPEGLVREGEER